MRRARLRRVRVWCAAGLTLASLVVAACRERASRTATEPSSDPLSAPPPAPAVLVGAGDIASCSYQEDAATAALLDTIPGTVFTTGDNAYPDGSAADYAYCYGPTWGRHKYRTRPVPGSHDYNTPGASGYFDYFGEAAGPRGLGYYSYQLGDWHIVALNSYIDMGLGSAQLAWLRNDLGANASRCVLAYWHHPRFSSGLSGGSTRSWAVWETLYGAGVDVVLNGDEHQYERLAPLRPDGVIDTAYGVRQFVVGTGGRSDYPFGSALPSTQARRSGTPGVLALQLYPDRYSWRFVPAAGWTFTDSGTTACHGIPGSEP